MTYDDSDEETPGKKGKNDLFETSPSNEVTTASTTLLTGKTTIDRLERSERSNCDTLQLSPNELEMSHELVSFLKIIEDSTKILSSSIKYPSMNLYILFRRDSEEHLKDAMDDSDMLTESYLNDLK
ncbi:unnamed protein product [Didymodactylos carnosus]|uniref:Uncharacterized protein n=1 Tax=Didymodactylos carnosus TaxID=1234261 RepID=A0A814NG48_9BILA|nr:unnamed protein product [Didymodactylos carnosus]CAF1213808.1 unnamed protein product [Didymodactylos carnosus]CAF3855593.1 unnamed protein product [Didymodactylos carnosus]CAF4022570.1 unnamed protein product [Didymodactylos carnosus]